MAPNKKFNKASQIAMLRQLFGDLHETMHLLAPEGWQNSQWHRAFHPDAQQYLKEALEDMAFFDTFAERMGRPRPGFPPPKLEDFADEINDGSQPMDELKVLLAAGSFSMLEENGRAIDQHGNALELHGEDRGITLIGHFLNSFFPFEGGEFDYDSFCYAGPAILGRTDPHDLFVLLFQRLRAKGYDWCLQITFDSFADMVDGWKEWEEDSEEEPMGMESYNPNAAFEQEFEKAEKIKRYDRIKMVAQQMFREDIAKWNKEPLPIVKAYQKVFGHNPMGYPVEV